MVYDNARAFPAFTVKIRLRPEGPRLPDPYVCDEATGHRYLRALPSAHVGFVSRILPTGVRGFVDAAVPHVHHEARLIWDWTVASGHAAVAEETAALQVQLDEAQGTMTALQQRLDDAYVASAVLSARLEAVPRQLAAVAIAGVVSGVVLGHLAAASLRRWLHG